MDIRLIAIDVDQTLITGELVLLPVVHEAIREAQEAGVAVTLATGRMFASAQRYAKLLNIDMPLITYNGALVQSLDGTKHAQFLLAQDDLVEVIAAGQDEGVTVNVYVDDELYVAERNEEVDFYVSVAQVGVNEVGDLISFANGLPEGGGALKVLLCAEPEKIKELLPRLQARYKDRFEVVTSHARFIEVTAKNVSKGVALDSLCKQLGLTSDQVMAIGDNFNDITMLRYAGIGVAMGNADQEVKDAADVVVGTVEEGGVAEAIRRFVLDPAKK